MQSLACIRCWYKVCNPFSSRLNHSRGDKIVQWQSKGERHELPCIQNTSCISLTFKGGQQRLKRGMHISHFQGGAVKTQEGRTPPTPPNETLLGCCILDLVRTATGAESRLCWRVYSPFPDLTSTTRARHKTLCSASPWSLLSDLDVWDLLWGRQCRTGASPDTAR